jgi:hypothetical protein
MAESIRARLFHNFGLKLLSLALAVGLWLAVARDPSAVVALDVPVEFDNIPENLQISSESIPRVESRRSHFRYYVSANSSAERP